MTTRDNRGRFGRKRDGMSDDDTENTSGENILPGQNDVTGGELERRLDAETQEQRANRRWRQYHEKQEQIRGSRVWHTDSEGNRVPGNEAAQAELDTYAALHAYENSGRDEQRRKIMAENAAAGRPWHHGMPLALMDRGEIASLSAGARATAAMTGGRVL